MRLKLLAALFLGGLMIYAFFRLSHLFPTP